MGKLRIYMDVDGTLSDTQCGNSFFKESCGKREDVIAAVKKASDAGHEIFIWTGSTRYARKVASELEKRGIKIAGVMGKPHIMVDNELGTMKRRLKRRLTLPEAFVQNVDHILEENKA